jgi:hypothetical protein
MIRQLIKRKTGNLDHFIEIEMMQNQYSLNTTISHQRGF